MWVPLWTRVLALRMDQFMQTFVYNNTINIRTISPRVRAICRGQGL